jgi:hypothetical protein
MKKRMLIFTVMSVLFLALGTAQAGILQTWNSETQFLADNTGLAMESFESYADGTPLPLATSGFVVSTDNTSYGSFNAVNTFVASDGSKSVRYGADDGQSIFFTFNSPVTVFGMYIMDFGTTGGTPVLTFYDDKGDSQIVVAGENPGTIFYGAELSSAITQVQFKMTGSSGDGIYFDSVYSGSKAVVPIPAAFWLLGSGIVGLIGMRKKMGC